MKNRILTIALIIVLSILILGLITILIFCLNFKGGFINFGTKSGEIIFDESYESNIINNIEILSDAGDIKFEESFEESIRVVAYGQDRNDVKVSLNENQLKVDYTGYSKKSWFNFGFRRNDIIVYLPESYSNEIKIKNNYGNCEIANLENATVNIDADYGNIELGKIKTAIIKCDYGNIEIGSILNSCDIKSDCGNIEIQEIQIQEDSIIKSDLGNVEIRKTNDIYVDAEVDLGNTSIKNNNRNSDITLKIRADCGNVTVGE